MLRILVILIIGGVIGAGIGFAGGIFVYPYIFLADVVANETLDASNRQAVADGTFIHANPSDPVHYGKGPVTVFRDLVRIENGFEVGPGPKYHVYLVKNVPAEEGRQEFERCQGCRIQGPWATSRISRQPELSDPRGR